MLASEEQATRLAIEKLRRQRGVSADCDVGGHRTAQPSLISRVSGPRNICIGAALRKSYQRLAGVPGLPIATKRFCRAYSSFSGCLPWNFRMRPCPTPARMMIGCTLSRRESFMLAWRNVYVQDSTCSQAPLTAHSLASKAERSISGMDTS